MDQFETKALVARFAEKRREALHDALRNITPIERPGFRSGIARRLRGLADRLEPRSRVREVRSAS